MLSWDRNVVKSDWIRQIVDSIRQFGFTDPVLIGDDGGVIAGHGRVLAAKEAGIDRVPTIKLSHLSPEQD